MATTQPTPHAAHPYAEFLDRVEKPARYAGGEVGAVHKDWATVEATVCLAFPDVYDIGMSHLGYKILYGVLNDDPRTLAERAYCPWVDLEAELRRRSLPLISLESSRPLRDFDVVGFSLQFELTFTNVLTMLDLGGIPLRADARGEDAPLVVAGGPNATHPEPMAPFFDAIVIGDGEAKLTELALTWTRLRKEGRTRRERLRALAALGGVYVPSLYATEREPDTGLLVVVAPTDPALPFPIERTMVNINDYPFPADGPTGGPEAIFDRTSIEITRGCTEGCRFCQAGMIYRPVQERDPIAVRDAVLASVKSSGNDEVSLTALSTADVSYINPLIKDLAPRLLSQGVSLSVSSLRAYGLEPELLDQLKRLRAGGLTFAPEAGTQRMRDVVNKNVTDEQLLETAERVFSRGWGRMKLYFMIGLPTEEEEDVLGIVDTAARTATVGRKVARRRVDVTASVSTHVPKPHTPFQWAAMDPLDVIRHKHQLLRHAVRQHRMVTLRAHDASGSELEGVIARGDRRLADVIERAWRAGARFDSWDDQLRLDCWEEAFEHFAIDKGRYLGTLPVSARLPWSHIDVGLEEGFLLREYRRALQDRLSPPCGKVAGAFIHHTNLEDAETDRRKLVCYDCGVACDMSSMRSERLVSLRRLGALERPAPSVELGPTVLAPAPRAGDPKAGHRYRLRFEKLGAVALLGHLDLVRELPRAFRRLDVCQVLSGGFKPKPIMAFSPALSLGAVSLDEYVDVRLADAFDEAALARLLEDLDRSTPAGLRFVAARRLGDDDPPISKIVVAARYAIGFARAALPFGVEALEARCAELLAATEVVMLRNKKGIHRKLNVRPFLRSLAVMDAEQGRALASRAGLLGDLVFVAAGVALTGAGSVRVAELAELLLGEPNPPHRAVRVALLDADDQGAFGSVHRHGRSERERCEPRAL